MRREILFILSFHLLSLCKCAALSFLDAGRPVQEDLSWKSNQDAVPLIDTLEDWEKKLPRVRKKVVSTTTTTTTAASPQSTSTPIAEKMREKRRRQSVASPKSKIKKKSTKTKGYPKSSIGFEFQLDPNTAYEDDEPGHSASLGRRKKQTGTPDNITLTLRTQIYYIANVSKWTSYREQPIRRKTNYGPCATARDCLHGEECFDVNTKNKIECPQGTTCEACDGQAKPCPKGCQPGNGCQPAPLDGICLDKEFAATDYLDEDEADLLERTPMVAFTGTLLAGQACNSYGAAIDLVQKGTAAIDEKVKILRTNQGSGVLGSEICNWSVSRLECIPNLPRVSTTPKSSGTGSQDTNNETPQGTCQCMLALGPRPVQALDEVKDIEICYIPANRGISSECDHEISPPHGVIDGLTPKGLKAFRGPEPASKFCVPNAECRTGYKYTGLRCMCQPKTKWDPKRFTCSKAIPLRVEKSFSLLAIVTIIIYTGLSS